MQASESLCLYHGFRPSCRIRSLRVRIKDEKLLNSMTDVLGYVDPRGISFSFFLSKRKRRWKERLDFSINNIAEKKKEKEKTESE